MIDPKLRAEAPVTEPLVAVAIPRLYAYHRALREAQASGKVTITSHGLAALLGHTITSTQIRKDPLHPRATWAARPGLYD